MASRTCWYCDNASHMTRIGEPYRPRENPSGGVWLVTASCDACSRPSLAEFTVNHQGDHNYDKTQTAREVFDAEAHDRREQISWHPNSVTVKAVEDVPSGIDEAAGEAIASLSIGAYKAAVLMCRAVIEATAKDHGISSGTLAAKITELETKRHITPATAEAAHEIRHLGNDMAHGDFATTSVTDAEAAEVVEITEALLEEIYQRPQRIARMKQRRVQAKSP